MVIFVEKITPRIQYVFKYIFKEVLGLSYQITNDITYFKKLSTAKINYTKYDFSDIINIRPHPLLFENNIKPQQIEISEWKSHKIFFHQKDAWEQSHGIPFDIFAAIFYLISRYEEYLPFNPDKYGRFEAGQSLAFKHGFLQEPIVNQWISLLKEELLKKHPALEFSSPAYRHLSTIDIDSAFAFKYKGVLRTFIASAMNLLKGDISRLKMRMNVLRNNAPDPFDVFSKLIHINRKYKIKPIWFFQVGKLGRYDKNISLKRKHFRALVKQIVAIDNVGIHPSYQSNLHPLILKMEMNTLQKLIKKPIVRSRQHYIKLSLPTTYRKLIKTGIREEYSMGYSSDIGFRAGTCTPFLFFDLKSNKETDLRIFPFQVMDACLNHYMQLSPQRAMEVIKELADKVRKVNGLFISVWHNESLSNAMQWEGWEHMYEEMLKAVQPASEYPVNR